MHVRDLADAHNAALVHLETHESGFFNLGTGTGASVREVVAAVERVSGKPVNVVWGERRPGDPPVLVAKADRAKVTLGWQPRRTLDEIVESAWRWHSRR